MHDHEFDWATGHRSEKDALLHIDPQISHFKADHRLLMLNGPNLNLLGRRDPTQYGTFTLVDVETITRRSINAQGFALDCFQTNHEGELVDIIQAARSRYTGIILNAGALTHYSYALRDAIDACKVPTMEVHISDIALREPFRQLSVIHPVCVGQVKGLGLDSYIVGARDLISYIVGQKKG